MASALRHSYFAVTVTKHYFAHSTNSMPSCSAAGPYLDSACFGFVQLPFDFAVVNSTLLVNSFVAGFPDTCSVATCFAATCSFAGLAASRG